MNYDNTKQIHKLMIAFMGLYHEKFCLQFRNDVDNPSDLKKNHIKILNLLYHENPKTLTEIGKGLDIEKGSLTALIDLLEERELIIRSVDSKDRRKNLIYLSPKGKDIINQRIAAFTKKMEESLAAFDAKDIQSFEDNLQQVVDFLKRVQV
ncbi:MarR family winged helix-turn-helix transcriptional regulator [Desulfitobacterium sp. PCE1]|uniref:MarR family transcriptional regulator n=1 Tax=Desulfitobacterium dehalogenans TaxID=36854 RepID=A0A7C7DAF2_9FIRM|nr:MarR family transcriptional regulator [Desulfitobacterium sp. PCE1]HHY27120.1 MarR family transcriptional regulator [Desulfitobacterium dehalogenans]